MAYINISNTFIGHDRFHTYNYKAIGCFDLFLICPVLYLTQTLQLFAQLYFPYLKKGKKGKFIHQQICINVAYVIIIGAYHRSVSCLCYTL